MSNAGKTETAREKKYAKMEFALKWKKRQSVNKILIVHKMVDLRPVLTKNARALRNVFQNWKSNYVAWV